VVVVGYILDLLEGGEITGRRDVLWFYGLSACS
jgi:hypothetical protein